MAAYAAGLDPSAVAEAAAAVGRAFKAARARILLRVAAAARHNSCEEGADGPRVLLPLGNCMLVDFFINRLHSDR